MTPAPWTAVLFDLDGTIIDSAPGILDGFRHTLTELGIPVPPTADLFELIGPPILDSFELRFGMTKAEAQHALDIYRPYYRRVGMFNATVYPGVPDVLAELQKAGIPVSLATSKPESSAIRILVHFGLDHYFTVMTGASEDDSRSAKVDVVADALRRLGEAGADLSRVVMVGDREHDVIGAAANDVPTVLVTWGYGSRAERAGTIAAVDSAAELAEVLGV